MVCTTLADRSAIGLGYSIREHGCDDPRFGEAVRSSSAVILSPGMAPVSSDKQERTRHMSGFEFGVSGVCLGKQVGLAWFDRQHAFGQEIEQALGHALTHLPSGDVVEQDRSRHAVRSGGQTRHLKGSDAAGRLTEVHQMSANSQTVERTEEGVPTD